jgi:hypothetical protein
MPFDIYGDVILTRDVTERGLGAGDQLSAASSTLIIPV